MSWPSFFAGIAVLPGTAVLCLIVAVAVDWVRVILDPFAGRTGISYGWSCRECHCSTRMADGAVLMPPAIPRWIAARDHKRATGHKVPKQATVCCS